MEEPGSTFRSVLIAVSIALAGWFVGNGFVRSRTADRFVTVKGVAERTVKADVGLWPLRFTAASEDLGQAQNQIENQRRTVMRFLARHGIDSTMTELQGLEVTDTRANPYNPSPSGTRFIIAMSLMVRSDDPERLRATGQDVGQLVDAGVVLSSGGGGGIGGPTFLFTRLNDFKPAMIAEATASARQAAEQFAKDSKSRVGGIRRASQGVFEILPRDQAPGVFEGSQLEKTLRVVSTVEYYLKN